MQIHGSIEIRCLHKQISFALGEGQQVVGGEPLCKEVVEHIFRGEMKLYAAMVGSLDHTKTFAQVGGGIGNVLHDMWRQPQPLHPLPFHHTKNPQCLLFTPHPVIHSWEQM